MHRGRGWLLAGSVIAAACAAAPPRTAAPKPPPVHSVDPFAPLPSDAPLPDAEAVLVRDATFLMPPDQALERWRSFAQSRRSLLLTLEALKQLAWLRDSVGLDAAIAALARAEPEVQEQAALALAEYGPPLALRAREALLSALAHAEPRSQVPIVWALIELGEPKALEPALRLYLEGRLASVTQLDGTPGFDLGRLAALLSEERAVALAQDPRASMRRLAAARVSQSSTPARRELLARLAADSDLEVSHFAAQGLGRLGEAGREPLLKALRGAAAARRNEYVDALARSAGVSGLLATLEASAGDSEERRIYFTEHAFQTIRQRGDPRGGDALDGFIQSKPDPKWELEAGFALAEIGDVRAVPVLARRIATPPATPAESLTSWQQARALVGDQRVVAARLIALLVALHPEQREAIRAQSEKQLLAWAKSTALPHPNVLRALAAIGSPDGVRLLARLADPKQNLPARGAAPPLPAAFVSAESALHWLGASHDKGARALLERQLKRRPKDMDATADAALHDDNTVRIAALKSLGVGAAEGLSELGDGQAFSALMTFVDSDRDNEDARTEACRALAWLATPEQAAELAKRAADGLVRGRRPTGGLPDGLVSGRRPTGGLPDGRGPSLAARFRVDCLLGGLKQRSFPAASKPLLALFSKDVPEETRFLAARALGQSGLDTETTSALLDLLDDRRVRPSAALALLLGADPPTASRAAATLCARSPEDRARVERDFKDAFAVVTSDDLASGRLFRRVANAEAIAKLTIGVTRQTWAKNAIVHALAELDLDVGPHSLSRPALGYHLWRLALNGDASSRALAVTTLGLMRRRGALLAVADRDDEIGRLARRQLVDIDAPHAER